MHIILIICFHKITAAVTMNSRFYYIKTIYVARCNFNLSHSILLKIKK